MANAVKKILIVEDEVMLSEMYQNIFKREGFKIVSAISGQEAVDVAKAEKPDFILLDILLPSENGVYFLQKKQEDPQIKSIPVVVFSNFDDPATKEKTFKLGVHDYLIKADYTPRELIEKVKEYIG